MRLGVERMNQEKLKKAIEKRNLTQEMTADAIKMSRKEWNSKMQAGADLWTIHDMLGISSVLDLSSEEARNIFFTS